MSGTKLKTVGIWQTMLRWRDAGAEPRTSLRGRVITGMLTGGDPFPDTLAVTADQRKE
jgi:hypothetical protein